MTVESGNDEHGSRRPARQLGRPVAAALVPGPMPVLPVSIVRSAGGCSCGRAGGLRRLPSTGSRRRSPIPFIFFSSSSAPSSCAAPAAPITILSTARSTPKSPARARGRSRAARSASPPPSSFLIVQALIGFLVLIQFDVFTILLGIASLGTIVIYPFLKRFTNWPQIGLGIAFSWGALMGWSALLTDLNAPPIVLYVGCIFWVIGYDTIYALQDKEDDALAGVRSTARLFGAKAKRLVAVAYACATALFAAAFWMAEVGTCRICRPCARRRPPRLAGHHPRYRQSRALPAAVPVQPRLRLDHFSRAIVIDAALTARW